MAEKRYTVVFDAKDMASSRLNAMEQQARKTSRGMEDLAKKTEKVSDVTTRLDGSYRGTNGRLQEANTRLHKVTDAVRGTNTEVTRSGSLLSRMGSEFSRIGTDARSDIGRLTGGLTSVVGILGSISAAAIGAGAAIGGLAVKGVWDHILKPAMDIESTKLQIDALSGSPEKGSEIYNMSKDYGMKSIYSNEDIMGGTFAFMQNTKNTDKLKEMLGITERLAALNKEEGFRGASFSLKEAMSGDITSIAERFNVGKKDLRSNGFDSAADWETNLRAVDQTLSGIGIDDNYVAKVAKSTPAQLAKMQKNVKSTFSAMGGGMLEILNPAFRKVNALFEDKTGMTKFTTMMSDKFQMALNDVFGFGEGVNVTWDDISAWSVDTFNGVEDILDSLGGTFTSTMELLSGEDLSGPKEAFQSFGTVLSGIASTIETINSGIDAMKSVDKASDSWFGGIDSMNESLYGDKKYGLLTGWAKPIVDMFSGDDGSHALGLSYVPKDNYRANLHEGERVLTKQENIAYMQGPGNASSGGVVITGNTFNVRSDADIDAIGEAILMRLQAKG